MSDILAAFGVDDAALLGAGVEARVYALDDARVLRVYHAGGSIEPLALRKRFCARLQVPDAPFSTPHILEVGEWDGTLFCIEARLPCVSLAQGLSAFDGSRRVTAWRAYVQAAVGIRTLPCPDQLPGEILAAAPMRRSDWTDFLVDRAAAELTRHEARLEGFNARPQRALKRLRDLADGLGSISMCLVHGDYTLENVMVDAHGAVCAVIDFGALTLVGDPQLDLACAVLFLTGLPGIDSADRAIVRAEAVRLGLTDDALALYTLYYAFRFLGASRDNDSLLRWCAGQIAAAGAH